MLEIIKYNAINIKYIENPTLTICIEAVKKNPSAIDYIYGENKKLCEKYLQMKNNSNVNE